MPGRWEAVRGCICSGADAVVCGSSDTLIATFCELFRTSRFSQGAQMSRPQRFVCRACWRHAARPRDQAPNPQGASGREWCYVEPQAGSFDEAS